MCLIKKAPGLLDGLDLTPERLAPIWKAKSLRRDATAADELARAIVECLNASRRKDLAPITFEQLSPAAIEDKLNLARELLKRFDIFSKTDSANSELSGPVTEPATRVSRPRPVRGNPEHERRLSQAPCKAAGNAGAARSR